MEYKVYLSTKVNPARLEPGTGIMALEPEDYTVDQIRAIKDKGYKVGGFKASLDSDGSFDCVCGL